MPILTINDVESIRGSYGAIVKPRIWSPMLEACSSALGPGSSVCSPICGHRGPTSRKVLDEAIVGP